MTAPKWTHRLLRRLAPPDRVDEVIGDLEEAHLSRLARHPRALATLLTALEALDMSFALLRDRRSATSGGQTNAGPDARTRSARPSRGFAFSLLDLKLGGRMLVKHPGMTLVGGAAVAVAMALTTGVFEFFSDFANPRVPLDEGDRIVGILNWDEASRFAEQRSLYDFLTWREEVTSIEHLGAYNTIRRNLITEDGRSEPVEIAEISASAFPLTRVPPLLGRTLLQQDEREDAAVVVLGYGVWQSRFGGDPDVIGETLRLGTKQRTVVGVMPEGFGFPIQHKIWVPLRADREALGRREGPTIRIFGRLAPGVDLESAQAELTAIGLRTAADFPDTHSRLRPLVMPLPHTVIDPGLPRNLFAVLGLSAIVASLILIAGLNVATLTFARAVTRQGEIAVRVALGASRTRIVAQLLAEALVLVGLAGVVGVATGGYGARWVIELFTAGGTELPFWWDTGLSTSTLVYAAVLVGVCTLVVGVVPALKVTRSLRGGLQGFGATAATARFGPLWTSVIVVQVGLSVLSLPLAVDGLRRAHRAFTAGALIPAEEFLSVRIVVDREAPVDAGLGEGPATRMADFLDEVGRRLEAEPRISELTFASALPGGSHPVVVVEVDGETLPDPQNGRVRVAMVAPGFFEAVGVAPLSGRAFVTGDASSNAGVVVVNESFTRRFMGERNPIGRRVRVKAPEGGEPGAWQEIVGVVPDLGMNPEGYAEDAGFYRPTSVRARASVHMILHVGDNPESLVGLVRTYAAEVDPTVRLYDLMALDRAGRLERRGLWAVMGLSLLVASIAVLLSSAGVHAMMSFVVSRRTKEIGVRRALGANPGRILAAVFLRALGQMSAGIALGLYVAAQLGGGDLDIYVGPPLLAAAAVAMLVIGTIASATPIARALRIEPNEALRES